MCPLLCGVDLLWADTKTHSCSTPVNFRPFSGKWCQRVIKQARFWVVRGADHVPLFQIVCRSHLIRFVILCWGLLLYCSRDSCFAIDMENLPKVFLYKKRFLP